MKWSHIDRAISASDVPTWREEIEPFYGENRGGGDRTRPAPHDFISLFVSRGGSKGAWPPRQPLPGITRSVAPKGTLAA